MERDKSHEQRGCGDKSHETCGSPGCSSIATERNRFFTGKYMTARDFRDEQEFFLSKHRLHNRLLHGWGILCGLEVSRHSNAECKKRWVVIQPGIAIDCCGRELVLAKRAYIELPLLQKSQPGENYEQQNARPETEQQRDSSASIEEPDDPCAGHQTPPNEPPKSSPRACGDTRPWQEMDQPFLLGIRFWEAEIERVPVLYNEGACDPRHEEANRLREGVCFDVRHQDQSDCWRTTAGGKDAHCRYDCDDPLPGPVGTCLDPVCPCGEMVPLALIKPDRQGSFTLDTGGRRQLRPPREMLTHIVYTNWTHGSTVGRATLRDEWNGRLEVRFDRKLRRFDDPGEEERYKQRYGLGINPYTFLVQYGSEPQRDLEYLESEGPPLLEGDDCVAVFLIKKEYLDTKGRDSLINNMIYITVKCDFILDCRGIPVDGNHLGGRLPSGDGVEGGSFESWFYIGEEEAEVEEDSRWQRQSRP